MNKRLAVEVLRHLYRSDLRFRWERTITGSISIAVSGRITQKPKPPERREEYGG